MMMRIEQGYSTKSMAEASQKTREKEYWLNKLSGELEKSVFPGYHKRETKDPRHQKTNRVYKKLPFQLTGDIFSQLMKISNRSDLRLYIVLIAGVMGLLHKYTGNRDIIIGAPVDRQERETQFINTVLILRNVVGGAMAFKELLLQVSKELREAAENVNYPLETLLYQLNIPYSPGDDFPLFEIAVLMKNIHEKSYLDHIHLNIVFSFEKKDNLIEGELEYNDMLYGSETAAAIISHYKKLLTDALGNPGIYFSRLTLLSEEERRQLLEEFNETTIDFPFEKTLPRLFAEQVEKSPRQMAVVCEEGQGQSTYEELNQQADRLAVRLREKGVKPDTIVGLMTGRTIEMVIGIMGILKAGGAYLPINPEHPAARIAYMLQDSSARILLKKSEIRKPKSETNPNDQNKRAGVTVLDFEPLNFEFVSNFEFRASNLLSSNLAYIIYTSGSTGRPKAVSLEHRNVVNLVLGLHERIYKYYQRGLRVALVAPYVFDASVQQIFAALLLGHTLYIVPENTRVDGNALLEFFKNYSIQITDGTPLHLGLMLESLAGSKVNLDLKDLLIGGEALPLQTVQDFFKSFEHTPPKISNVYGPAECCVDCTCFDISQENLHELKVVPIGTPLSNEQIYIMDRDMNLQPPGISGELCIAGEGVGRGYLNQPELTADKFDHDLWDYHDYHDGNHRSYRSYPSYIFYKTGDLARWLPQGNLEFLGRLDHQVKIRGLRIELGEIEQCLLACHSIKEALVMATEDKYLCAYVVPASPGAFNVSDIRENLSRQLPDYMIPSFFVPLERIPLTANGKIDRKALPSPDKTAGGEVYVPPHSVVEKKMAAIWSDILRIPGGEISIDSDFFTLGGHSLKATSLVSRIHKEFDVKIPLAEVFRIPRIKELSIYIKENAGELHVSIEPVEQKEYYPLSSVQKRLYVLQQMGLEDTTYNVPMAVVLDGLLNLEGLENTFRQLIERHESLRTSFHMIGDQPVQIVHDHVEFEIENYQVEDKVKVEEEGASRLEGTRGLAPSPILISSFGRPFDLSHSPLLRVGLIKEQEQKHLLMIDMHHIITDGVSMNLFLREAMELYSGEKLSPLRLQYKDYADRQVGDRQKKAIKSQEEYWLNRFADEIPVLNLPLDYPRPKVQSFEGAVLSFEVPRGLTRSINQMTLDTGATLYMVLLAVYNILLSKLSGQEDIIVGIPIAARRHADLERIIGMFVNTLAPRNYPNSEKTAREFLEEIKESTLQTFENQEYPFEDLVEKVFVHRDTSRNPIFDTMFALQNMETRTNGIAADIFPLKISPYEIDYHTAKFDLTLTCFEGEEKLFCSFEYCTKLFKKDTIERFIDYFQQILSAVLENPNQKIYRIEIIIPEEKQRILHDFNDTVALYPNNKNLPQLFEEQVERIPDHIALIGHNSRSEGTRGLAPLPDFVSITYRELNNRSHRLACILSVKGVSADTIVGIMAERSIEMIVGIFGILETGGAYLPIDPGYPRDRIEYMLKDSGAEILLKDNDLTTLPPSTLLPFYPSSPLNLAYIIYTSGTTGKPRGVMVEHSAVMNRLYWDRDKYRLNERDVILQATSFVFDVSVCEMFRWIPAGGSLCLLPPKGEKDPELIIKTIAKNGITTADFIPAMLHLLMDYAKQQNLFKELASLRWVWTGVEVVNISLVKIFNETLHRFNQTRLINAYGPTESTVDVTYFDCSALENDDVVPIGRPIANVRIFILSGNDIVQPVGVYGQLCIAGKGLARGYLNNPELTAEKFDHDGNHTSYRSYPSYILYKTGDLARWLPDGNIQFLGRIDHQVKIRGHRVELGEIENHLRRHPGVKAALVTIVETSAATGNKNLCAYITGKPGCGVLDIPGIKEFVSARLPDYMTPAYFCQLDEFPLTPGGKINRKALPLPVHQEPGAMVTPPGDELEKTLATLWAEVLEIDPSAIGIDTDFFKCGGNSLNAVVLAARIHKELNVKVPMMVLFETPFIRGLARYIRGAEKEKHLAVEVVEEKEYYALSPAQERLYILQQMEPNATAYNMPLLMELEGYLDKEKLERAFVQLIRRHESFRTSFEMKAGDPVQKIHKNVEFKIRYYDLATEVTEATEDKIHHLIHSLVRPFDLESPPLLWVVSIKVEERKHLLEMDIHHIVTDGISTAIMVREFMALVEGKELSPLKLQYKDFACWQNDRLETGEMKKQGEYWKEIFQGPIPVLQLPYDYPRPAVQSFAGHTIRFRLEPGETAALKGLAGKENVTFFIVLLSIYTLLLSRLSDQGDIVIGTPVAGRGHVDLQGIMGMFVNTLALKSRLEEGSTFTAFLKKVKKETTAAFDNQDYPFERLVEKISAARDTGRNPLFDVVFSLENMEIPALEIKGLRVSTADFGSLTAKFDLNLSAVESGDCLQCNFQYCTKLFKEETVERFIVYFKQAVSAVVNGPNQEIAGIDIIPPEERDRLLFEFNATGAEYPGDKTIHRLFEEQVERTPDHTVLVDRSDRSDMSDLSYISITYRELNEQSGKLAGLLIEKGVQPDTIVGIMVERSVEMVVGIMGILKSGGAYLPIDPDLPRERIEYMLKDSGTEILINKKFFRGSRGAVFQKSPPGRRRHYPSAKQAAYIIYTSGTTGQPKGTLVEHCSLVNLCYWHNRYYGVTGEDRATQYAAVGFDASVWEIFPYLIKGVVVHILSAELKIDIKRLADYYRKNHITISFLPTQVCQQFMEEISDLPLLRILLTGGAKLDRFIQRPYRLYNNYGPTENTVVTTAFPVESYRDNIPIGKPVANVRVYILSNNTGRLQPIGVPGELCISGASMSRGYLNHPGLTVEKFYLRPARGAGTHHSTTHHSPLTIYRTGDLARWLPDGNIEFIGRIDAQVKIRGFRIEPGEIEIRLSQHENIKEAVVIDRTDSSGEKYLCAYVVYRKPNDVKPTELKSYLSQTLPEYMIPAHFVEIEKIPLNPNGKVDRNLLPEPGARPRSEYVAPGTDKEREIAEIWKQVLGLEKVGIYDNFFDTGGNSLKIIKLTIELKKHLGIELPTAKMFQYTTIAAQARYIGGADEKKSEEGDLDFDAAKAKNKLKQRRNKTRS